MASRRTARQQQDRSRPQPPQTPAATHARPAHRPHHASDHRRARFHARPWVAATTNSPQKPHTRCALPPRSPNSPRRRASSRSSRIRRTRAGYVTRRHLLGHRDRRRRHVVACAADRLVSGAIVVINALHRRPEPSRSSDVHRASNRRGASASADRLAWPAGGRARALSGASRSSILTGTSAGTMASNSD